MKYKQMTVTALFAALALAVTSCGPAKVEVFEEIESNETAFVISLESDSSDQKQFESVDYLEKQKVASKRINIPIRKKDVGRFWFSYEWVPTVRVVSIDRAPVTRQWTGQEQKSRGASIAVESKDSIGFTIGVNITAYVDEEDTSKFLYYYRSKQLSEIIDENVRGYVQMQLSEEFGSRDLQDCKAEKNLIMEKVRPATITQFEKFGITITALGMAEGLAFEDQQIQDAINDAYVAEMMIVQEKQKAEAQLNINERLLNEATGKRAAAEEFEKAIEAQTAMVELEIRKMTAEAYVASIQKWNGNVPYFWTGGGGGESNSNPFLFQMPSSDANE